MSLLYQKVLYVIQISPSNEIAPKGLTRILAFNWFQEWSEKREFTVQLISGVFEHSVLRIQEIYGLYSP